MQKHLMVSSDAPKSYGKPNNSLFSTHCIKSMEFFI